MSRTSIVRRLALASLASLALAFAQPGQALAEDPPAGGAEQQLKEQMEKIIKLMEENEQALIELSAGGKDRTKRPDVDIPPDQSNPPPSGSGGESGSSAGGSGGSAGGSGGSAGGSGGSAGGSGGSAGSQGAEIRKRIEELLKGQGRNRQIPGEIEQLIRMIPKGGQGQGQGQPKDQQGEGQGNQGEQPKPQPRDGRRPDQMEQGGEEPQGQKPGEGEQEGAHKPRDPKDPRSDRPPEDDRDRDRDPENGEESWRALLPAEVREAYAGKKWTEIPRRYRELIERYLETLRKNR